MANRKPVSTGGQPERAILVGVEFRGDEKLLPLDESLDELRLLAMTAGVDAVAEITQSLERPNVKTFIGAGKVNELKSLADEFDASMVLFDDELSPRHQRELEKILGDDFRVLDRTALILDIFAQHASTHEGALQVELAQYEYRLPRLTRAWTHLARQAGGGGGRAGGVGGVGLRGPGETQLESDRREIGLRISQLKKELEKVRAHRGRYRARRRRSRIPTIALVGYTNAGKSTLINALTDSEVYVADKLFATLDPTTRKIELPGGREALLTDTVGFIQKLPANLVEAFKATLEEIAEADLLLHVMDITHPYVEAQAEAVRQTLSEIEADHIPVLNVFNKIDKLSNFEAAIAALDIEGRSVAISARKKVGLEDLLVSINLALYDMLSEVNVALPYDQGALISQFHQVGRVDQIEHTREGVLIRGRLPGRLLAAYSPYELVEKSAD